MVGVEVFNTDSVGFKVETLPNKPSERTENKLHFVKVTHLESGIATTAINKSQVMALHNASLVLDNMVREWNNNI